MINLSAVLLVLLFASGTALKDDKQTSLEGIWIPTAAELAGHSLPEEIRKSIQLEVRNDTYKVTIGPETDRGTCKRDPTNQPNTLDITSTEGPNKGKTFLAIYERSGETLRICYDLGGKHRPEAFKSTRNSEEFLVTYNRKMDERAEPKKNE